MVYINYAKALLRVAKNIKESITLSKELACVENFISTYPEFYSYFTPIYSQTTQMKILHTLSILTNISEVMKRFIEIISINGRIHEISMIYDEYQKLIDNKQNIKKAIIYSATEISNRDKKIIETFLKKHFDYKFEFENIVNSDLMQGIQIIVDSKVIDLSASEALNFYHNILRGA